mgnify:CR=1 FL=1
MLLKFQISYGPKTAVGRVNPPTQPKNDIVNNTEQPKQTSDISGLPTETAKKEATQT